MTAVGRNQDSEYQAFAPLFHELVDSTASESYRRQIRDRLVTGHLPVAEHIARRFRRRGQPDDDLTQVAMIGLINAVDRFDPRRGSDFLAFAVPTITGEIRRYFRDSTWAMRVPRRLKELHATVTTRADALAQVLGRAPRPSDLAAELNLSIEDISEGLQVGFAYRGESLEAATDGGSTTSHVGVVDRDLVAVENREALYPALSRLPPREASIVMMRFFGNMTQSQIADRIGLSQMQVSRLLSASIKMLRNVLAEDGDNVLP